MTSTDHRAYWYCIIRNDAGQDVKVRRARWATPARGFHRFEAECSCGWQTRTGGAIPAAIQRQIDAHRAAADAHLAIGEAKTWPVITTCHTCGMQVKVDASGRMNPHGNLDAGMCPAGIR